MRKSSGIKKVLGLVAALSLSVSSAAHAGYTPVNAAWPGEASQSDILSHAFGGSFATSGLNFTNGKVTATRMDDSTNASFHYDIASMTTLGTFSSAHQGLAFDAGNGLQQLFDVSGKGFSAVGGTGTVDMPSTYSLVRTGSGREWSSDAAKNSDGADHLVTYLLTGKGVKGMTYVMFWEDGAKGHGDFDFNDLAVEVKAASGRCDSPSMVPLPPAAWSGLATLAGGVLVTGYRKAKAKLA